MHPLALHELGQSAVERTEQLPVGEERERRSGVVDRDRHRLRSIGIEPRARRHQTGRDPQHHATHHCRQRVRIGAAHIAVPYGAHQRGQCVHQVADVDIERRPLGHELHDGWQRLADGGEEAVLDHRRELGERSRPGGALGDGSLGSGRDGGAQRRRLDQAHLQLWLPQELPGLPERAGRSASFDLTPPRHAQHRQPVQQMGSVEVERPPQIELERAGPCLWLEPAALLLEREIARKGHHRRARGHPADERAHDELVAQQHHRRVGAVAQYGASSVTCLDQTGQRPAAQRCEGRCQACRLHDIGGRDGAVVGPQDARRFGEPTRNRVGTWMGEQVVVPTRRGDSSSVTRRRSQAAMGPRHPRDGDLGLGHAAQHSTVCARLLGVRGVDERRDVPGPADDGDVREAVLDRGPDAGPHLCLAAALHRIAGHEVRFVRPSQDRHRLGDRFEGRGTVAMLDDVLPPALGVVVAASGCELGERIGWTSNLPLVQPAVGGFGPVGEGVRQREVDVAHRDAGIAGPPQRHPLRAERCKGMEHSPVEMVDGVAEHRHRWPHLRMDHEVAQRVGFSGSFDQHDVGPCRLEGTQHGASRAGAVMTDPVQPDGGLIEHRLGPTGWPASRGTRATRQRRAPGP